MAMARHGGRRILRLTFCVLALSISVNSQESNRGREFVVGFPSLAGSLSTAGWNELVISSIEKGATVQISGPGISRSIIVNAGNTSRLRFPGTVRMTRNRIENISFILTSDEDIGVIAVEIGQQAESYLALPRNSLPQRYIVPAYTVPQTRFSSQIAAIAFDDNTNVTFISKSPGQGYNYSGGFSVVLARGQSYQYSRAGVDLSGTMVTSDKPITVLSGVDCAEVPVKFQRCGLLVEQIPPIATWGRQFVMGTRLMGRQVNSLFRIIALNDGTNVTIPRLSNSLSKTINRGDVWEIDMVDVGVRYFYAECSGPCFVVSYNKGFSADTTRAGTSPFMTIIPAIGQFTADQIFSTFKRGDNRDFANGFIIISEFHGIKLNDRFYQSYGLTVPGTSFSVINRYTRFSDTIRLKHWSSNGTFAAFAYGQWFHAHGYPTGMALNPFAVKEAAVAEFYTPNDYKVYWIKHYSQLEDGRYDYGYLTFDVKTCRGAMIYLSQSPSDTYYGPRIMYHIEISGGDNRFSFIAKGQNGRKGVQVYTPNVVSCDEFSSFWVKWHYQRQPVRPFTRTTTISVGMGPCVDDREIMAWTDRDNATPNNRIIIPMHVGIGSYYRSPGWWKIHRKQDCTGQTAPPTGSPPTMDPSATPSLPPYGEFQERCGCRFAIESNTTAGEQEPGGTVYTLDDIIYNLTDSRSGECLGCEYVMDRCRIDCTEQALALWKPNGLYNLIEVEGGIGPRERAVGQLLCEAHLADLEPPGRRIVVYYDPGRCGEQFHTTVFPQSLCCKEIDIPEIGFVVVWDHQCDGNVQWPADKQILYGNR